MLVRSQLPVIYFVMLAAGILLTTHLSAARGDDFSPDFPACSDKPEAPPAAAAPAPHMTVEPRTGGSSGTPKPGDPTLPEEPCPCFNGRGEIDQTASEMCIPPCGNSFTKDIAVGVCRSIAAPGNHVTPETCILRTRQFPLVYQCHPSQEEPGSCSAKMVTLAGITTERECGCYPWVWNGSEWVVDLNDFNCRDPRPRLVNVPRLTKEEIEQSCDTRGKDGFRYEPCPVQNCADHFCKKITISPNPRTGRCEEGRPVPFGECVTP